MYEYCRRCGHRRTYQIKTRVPGFSWFFCLKCRADGPSDPAAGWIWEIRGHLTFVPIDEPYTHGYSCVIGDREARVIRTSFEDGHWTVFCYIGGKMVSGDPINNKAKGYYQALQEATDFLQNEHEAFVGV